MTTRIVVVGDSTDHGGQVMSGSPTRDIDGQAIARIGDKVLCPLFYPGGKPHGLNQIVGGHASVTVDGVPVAVDGSSTECGCKLIGSKHVFVD